MTRCEQPERANAPLGPRKRRRALGAAPAGQQPGPPRRRRRLEPRPRSCPAPAAAPGSARPPQTSHTAHTQLPPADAGQVPQAPSLRGGMGACAYRGVGGVSAGKATLRKERPALRYPPAGELLSVFCV